MKFNVQISAVQAGQKSSTVNAEPRLIANSTPGKFQITSAVSKALGISVGENIQFFNNTDGLEKLANNPTEDVLQFCEENGIDINTAEGKRTFVDDNTVWFIAKGHQEFTSNGKPIMTAIRCTKEDKLEAIKQQGAELIKDEAFRAVLIERVGNEDATDEELIAAIDVDDIESPKTESYTGSKTATTGSATGVGCPLNFTDTSIWNAMKADLAENKDKKNRVYNVLLDQPVEVPVNNGFKDINVTAYPVEFVEDKDPIVRGAAE
jgi:hypothetical protein